MAHLSCQELLSSSERICPNLILYTHAVTSVAQ